MPHLLIRSFHRAYCKIEAAHLINIFLLKAGAQSTKVVAQSTKVAAQSIKVAAQSKKGKVQDRPINQIQIAVKIVHQVRVQKILKTLAIIMNKKLLKAQHSI